jgi:putative spermidine/putrescine transport system ATP-binding protein
MTIALDNVSFKYPAANAGVDGVTLSIAEGELLAVIGPSGCGKSTVLKLIAGFLAPDTGRVLLGGRDATTLTPRYRNLGVVFQNYALFPHMTVAENIHYPLKLRRVPRSEAGERVRKVLDMIGLTHLADRRPTVLSGGQQQRVALGRALVFQPSALLLDEPLSALDATLRVEMRDEISRLQKHYGIATLHITHDQEEAMSIADKLAVMRDGRVLQVGAPRDVYAEPANRSVAAFVGLANLIEGEVLDGSTVRTAFGNLMTRPHAFAAGAKTTILIRPERIRLSPAPGTPNAFDGRIVRDRFLGSMRRIDFALERGPVLSLETDDMMARPSRIHLPPESVQVINRDDGTSSIQQSEKKYQRVEELT